VTARALLLFVLSASFAAACGSSTAPDPRYPARPQGCAVKSYPEKPTQDVDELGDVVVDCAGTTNCPRRLLDAVCARGGDVAWGLAENPVSQGATMRAHAAHSAHRAFDAKPVGCDVKVFADAPPMKTQNIGAASASCAEDATDDDCVRALQDEVCKLGGDVVWGVSPPRMKNGRKRVSGRAAHTQ
jgi:hypothetical protein